MKNKRLLYALLILAGCGAILFSFWQRDTIGCLLKRRTPQEKWAEQTIRAYIEEKSLNIRLCTDKYNALLKGVLLGDVPELIRTPSAFIQNDVEGQYILEYASNNFHVPKEMKSSFGTEEPVFEAVP